MEHDERRYVVVIREGGMIRHAEEPEGVELVHLDYDDLEHNDPDLRSMAGFERCASCSHARDLHRGGRCVLRDAGCSGWEPTGLLVDDRPMKDLEGYETDGTSEEATAGQAGDPAERAGVRTDQTERPVEIHVQELEPFSEAAFRYEAYAQTPWRTHGSGGLVGYSDDSELDAARQLKRILLDLGLVDCGFVVRGSRGEVIETDRGIASR